MGKPISEIYPYLLANLSLFYKLYLFDLPFDDIQRKGSRAGTRLD
jgi:hypothetical protein